MRIVVTMRETKRAASPPDQETHMNFINEYALLFAVALPVATLVGIQVFLFVSGERGTGLLPGLSRYPSIETGTKAEEVVMVPAAMPATSSKVAVSEPSNDEMEREAA
jgi:hypothetical protein